MTPSEGSGERAGIPSVEQKAGGPKFKSVRRVLRIMDLVSRRGETLTAKELAREVGTNLSSCYYLLKVLTEEGYIEKIPHNGGDKGGPGAAVVRRGGKGHL